MPLIALQMDSKAYSHAARPTRTSPVSFKPPSVPRTDPSVASPPSPNPSQNTTSMNYSPRHSRKPSSLSSSRNISIQRLSLNNTSPVSAAAQQSPRRGKSLALSIPSNSSPTARNFAEIQTPVRENMRPGLSSPVNGETARFGSLKTRSAKVQDAQIQFENGLRSPFKSSPEALPGPGDKPTERLLDIAANSSEVGLSPSFEDQIEAVSDSSSSYSSTTHAQVTKRPENSFNTTFPVSVAEPEELQEIGLTYAYLNGPANVLNSRIYLYCEPKSPGCSLDINDYDLVINVARECADLSHEFNDVNGTKKYLRVLWSHTSAISKDLPMITREMAAMDRPGKKILVHCQCGVSRSACVVVAYFMVKFKISVNEAYELLKSGTDNVKEACSQKIKDDGNHVDACERICPNMSLIFELMDFGDKLDKS